MCHDNLQDYSYNIYGIFYSLTNHAAINYKWIALPNIQNGMQKIKCIVSGEIGSFYMLSIFNSNFGQDFGIEIWSRH